MPATLPKEERLSGKTAIATLVSKGHWSAGTHVKYCVYKGNGLDHNRILVSVPKKYFKRAVRRNLLKRRLRESYRTQKDLLNVTGTDIMFVWSSPEVSPFGTIKAEMAEILSSVK